MNTATMTLLLGLGSVEAAAAFSGPFRSVAGQSWTAGSATIEAQHWQPGSVSSQTSEPCSREGQGD